MSIKSPYRFHGLARGMVSEERLNALISFTKLEGDFVKRGLYAHFVRGFNAENVAMIYYNCSGNFSRDMKKIRNIAANYEELIDYQGDINELVPGNVSQRKLDIFIDSVQLKSAKVKAVLRDHFVHGKSKKDIVVNHSTTHSNINREVKKIQAVADKFQDLHNITVNQINDR